VNLLVDTSVWSLALRRDAPSEGPAVSFLRRALEGAATVLTTGIVLQELLQGVKGPKAHQLIVVRFSTLPFVIPDRQDHIDAAALHTRCRRRGIQVGTIDVLLAQLCLRHRLTMLTADRDCSRIGDVTELAIWKP